MAQQTGADASAVGVGCPKSLADLASPTLCGYLVRLVSLQRSYSLSRPPKCRRRTTSPRGALDRRRAAAGDPASDGVGRGCNGQRIRPRPARGDRGSRSGVSRDIPLVLIRPSARHGRSPGRTEGSRTVPIPSLASTASKAVENLLSRSRSRIVGCTPAISRLQHRFLACWGNPTDCPGARSPRPGVSVGSQAAEESTRRWRSGRAPLRSRLEAH